jgi:DNA-binding winged helix-turn-helix (wHTH) protein
MRASGSGVGSSPALADGGGGVTYRFDDFALDVGTRRLLRHDEQELHLSPKAFDLLTILVEHRSQAMSKTDLQEKLWPSTFVQETNLAGLVAEIRRALDDPAESPRYVRTVHRFGYWFVGNVDAEQQVEVVASPARYWLLWETRQIALNAGDNVLGRAADASVWIDAPGVSRYHARIRLEGTDATVEDLGSKNGTYVGGRRVMAPSPLTDGDQIRLGSVVIIFRIPPVAGSTETALS